MKILWNKLEYFYKSVISSIAFYPSIIFITFSVLAVLALQLESGDVTKYLYENAPYLIIKDTDNARAILSTLISSIISLTVFSFSMVMILLNQASSNFSPRLLPGLISDKNNQLTLGVFLGSIIYNLIILISLSPTENDYARNGFSIILGIVSGIVCLVFFVFFIHSISTNIQIDNILEKIFDSTKERLMELADNERKEADEFSDSKDNWQTIYSDRAGYYHGVDKESLLEMAEECEVNVKVLPYKGKYLLPKMPLVLVDKKLNEESKDKFRKLLKYSINKNAKENYVLGIKQITEVGVKAMSPGINDPGTAVMTLDHLTELLALRMKIRDHEVYSSEDKNIKVELKTVDFDTLLYQSMASYRQYCKHDMILVEKMFLMYNYLLQQEAKSQSYIKAIEKQKEILEEDYLHFIKNSHDKEKISQLMKY